MDNNFWISAAIAAVVGGAWLFKKGKSAYSFIRKIRRSFKGVCLNPKSRLTDEQCKKDCHRCYVCFSARSISKLDRNRYSRYASQNTWRMVGN